MYVFAVLVGCFLAQVGAQLTGDFDLVAQKGCKFNGRYYKYGETIKGHCFIMVCTDSGWKYNKIDRECARCLVWQDPNFYTFDNNYYIYHGKCNYTITQRYPAIIKGDFGIYSVFDECWPGSTATCLQETTFKVDKFTAVTIDHNNLPNFWINNNLFTPTTTPALMSPYPVFAYKSSSNCVYFQGPISLIACRRTVYVFAGQHLSGYLKGLCGYFDNNVNNDHTRRDGTVDPLTSYPIDFPRSWLSLQQPSKKCFDPEIPKIPHVGQINPCENEQRVQNLCWTASGSPSNPIPAHIELIIDSCVEQLCGDDSENENFWLKSVRETVAVDQEVRMQTGEASDGPPRRG